MPRYLVFAVVAIPVFLGQASGTAVAVAFPSMVNHFGVSLVLAGWVLSIYQLVIIAAIPVIGRLSDTVGRRSTFMLCLASFTVGSILCAIAPNMGWLIFFRVIQATGGGGFVASASGIITDRFPNDRHKFIGLLSSIATLGQFAGPNMGGPMVEYFGWQSVFWLNVPIAVTALVLCWFVLKADTHKTAHGSLDFFGIGLLTASTSAVMISLTLMDKAYGMSPYVIVAMVLLGILLATFFYYRSKHNPDALISADLLTRRPFMASNLYNLAVGACAQSGVMTLIPLYAGTVYGMNTIQSGLMMTPRSFGIMVASFFASFSLFKWGYRRPLIIGTLLVAAGTALLGLEPGAMNFLGITIAPITLIMVFSLIVGVGAGVASPAANNACIEIMPEKAASITGIRQIYRQMGGAIGIAVCTLVLETSPNMAIGFSRLLIGFSIMPLLAVIPAFFMPASPVVARPSPAR